MNIYEEIKSRLTNIEVAIRYLGQPKAMAPEYALFNSPFREDRRPSFSVNAKGYIDFGSGNYYGDMIQFVKELRGYQFPYQAAEEIIDVFGLDITIPEKAINVKEKKTRKKTSELYLQKSDKSNKAICMFDSQGYQSKPQKEQIAYIKSRISNLKMQEYTLQEVKDNITNGRTIIPSGIKGNAKENWEKQQIFLVDLIMYLKETNYTKMIQNI